jgi:hypothetical protein
MKRIFCILFSLTIVVSSCTTNHVHVINVHQKKPKGWYMNSNNPHHPHTTNPGHRKKMGVPSAPGNSKGIPSAPGNSSKKKKK